MTSIITNQSSMTALQTLKNINKGLTNVQAQVSSGLKIANAKDNASVWAIAATMRADVAGFKAINDGLGSAIAAVSVANNAAETISGLLTQMRDKVIEAGATGADTDKIADDIVNLREMITSVVEAASFNGVNLINNTDTVRVLTSVDRVNSASSDDKLLDVVGADLRVGGTVIGGARAALTGGTAVAADDGELLFIKLDAAGGTTVSDTVDIDDANLIAGDRFEVTIGSRTASYTLTAADVAAGSTEDVVAVKLKAAVEALGIAGLEVDYDITNPGQLVFTNTGAADLGVAIKVSPMGSGGVLDTLLDADTIGDDAERTTALAIVDAALDAVNVEASRFGSTQKRLEIQQEFISKLADSLTIGISALVDADMEEASARLAALQTQQQLGIQSLSIANQSPQSIMALFR